MHKYSKLLMQFIFSSVVAWASLTSIAMAQTDATRKETLSKFEVQVQRVLELADSAREGQIGIEAWPRKRVAEMYDPAVCVFDESKPLLRKFGDRSIRVRVDQIYVDDKAVKVNSPEFNALSIHVDPVSNLEFSCTEKSCSGVIPFNSSEPDTSGLREILNAKDWVGLHLIQDDFCQRPPNWCDVDRRECIDHGVYYLSLTHI